jgi:hypothetical protein
MPRDNRVTAHIKRISQDKDYITTLVMTDKQLLELIGVATIALREQRRHPDGGYHLAIWKSPTAKVKACQPTPPCEGGDAHIVLAHPGGARAAGKAPKPLAR